MTVTTGLSGNELFCLEKKGYAPGNIVVGNSVYSLGLVGRVSSGFKAVIGGEIEQITHLIMEGRDTAYQRMFDEAKHHGANGITGVKSQIIFHNMNIEFLSIGSALHSISTQTPLQARVATSGKTPSSLFSTSADGQELYAQLDAGYEPLGFCFGNTAYSIGLGRGILGGLKTFARGEIREYSDMFNHTRHLALRRIITHAQSYQANAVLGIQTSIIPIAGAIEMLMIGTASRRIQAVAGIANSDQIATSDMTNVEMWNMANLGYAPMKLLLGTSVYSLGLVGNVTSVLKSFARGEISELTRLIYVARENALGIINDEAKAIGADDVVGVKTYVYQLGNGLIEFLAIGTAVKKVPEITTLSDQLPVQAIVVDKSTFFDSNNQDGLNLDLNAGKKPINQRGASKTLMLIVLLAIIFSSSLKQFFFH